MFDLDTGRKERDSDENVMTLSSVLLIIFT